VVVPLVSIVVASIAIYPNRSLIVWMDEHIVDRIHQDYWRNKHLTNNPFLKDNYAPIAEEHVAVRGAGVVEGSLPPDLSGLFVRNGPNPVPQHEWRKGYHWFDGHGHLHTLRIKPRDNDEKEQELLYSNQYIPTPRYLIERFILGKEFFFRMGEMTGVSGLLKAMVWAPIKMKLFNLSHLTVGTGNTHTTMTAVNHKIFAGHEASLPFELVLDDNGSIVKDPPTNDNRMVQNAQSKFETLGGILDYPVSAHPKVDPRTGNLLFHSYSAMSDLIQRDGNYKVGEYNPHTDKVETYYGVRTNDGHTSFAHDMMFTTNWFVLYDSSVHLDVRQVLNTTATANGEPARLFQWNASATLKLGLAPRHGANATSDDVIWFDVGTPHAMIHPLNAWEEEDGTVLLWSPIADSFDANLEANTFYMAEFRMNPNDGRVTKAVIDTAYNVEFPRVRHSFLGKFARYGTATIMNPKLGGDGLFDGFVVYDMLDKQVHKVVKYRSGDIGGEAVIIPKPGTGGSGEFYLGTFVWNKVKNKSFFLLYDGEVASGHNDYVESNESESLVARIELPYRIPYGFHGEWYSENQLQAHLKHHSHGMVIQ
jgi:carotenoid cleavage dioxygenase